MPTWLLWFVALLWTVPTVGIFVGSFRVWPGREPSGWWTHLLDTETWTLGGYRAAIDMSVNNSFAEGMLSSLAIAVPSTLIPLLIAAVASYAIAWIPFRGKGVVFFGLVALIAMPIQVALIPLLQMFSGGAHLTLPLLEKTVTVFPDLGLAGTIPAVWIVLVGSALPFSIFFLSIAMTLLPSSLVDAARADGATHLQVLWRIVLPLQAPSLAGLGVLLFLWSWNDLLVALTMIGGGNPAALPATVKLASISLPPGGPVIAAGAFIHSSVAIVVFLALQRFFVRGLVTGAE